MNFIKERRKLIESNQGNIGDFYTFERTLIGEGTYGSVKIATRLIDNKRVAVKILNKKSLAYDQIFTREIQVMKRADHPHIVRLLETY